MKILTINQKVFKHQDTQTKKRGGDIWIVRTMYELGIWDGTIVESFGAVRKQVSICAFIIRIFMGGDSVNSGDYFRPF